MQQNVMYSNLLVRMETDGIYISINVETVTEAICRGDCHQGIWCDRRLVCSAEQPA